MYMPPNIWLDMVYCVVPPFWGPETSIGSTLPQIARVGKP